MSERKFASYRGQTHNHQVMSPTRSPLSHPGGAEIKQNIVSIIAYVKQGIAEVHVPIIPVVN